MVLKISSPGIILGCKFVDNTGGVNSKKGCFGKKQFLWKSEDFVGNQSEAFRNFRETQSNEVKFFRKSEFFGGISPKILG